MYNEARLLGKTSLLVSRLGLGTAEIGFAYGLGNPKLPQEDEALVLLNAAVEMDVKFFDTANYYGFSEERIGKSGILKNNTVIVSTKCAQFLEKGDSLSKTEIEKRIREQVSDSLTILKLETLPLLLLHGPSEEQIKEGTLTLIMKKLQDEKKIRYWGASTRGEDAALAAIAVGADALQVAFSIADQRMSKRVFPAAIKNGVGIINRSVFLKGVFAGKAQHLSDSLMPLKNVAAIASDVAGKLGVSVTELALRFTLSEPAIAVSLIGTAEIKHLKDAADAIVRGSLPEDVIATLRALALEDPKQIDPIHW